MGIFNETLQECIKGNVGYSFAQRALDSARYLEELECKSRESIKFLESLTRCYTEAHENKAERAYFFRQIEELLSNK